MSLGCLHLAAICWMGLWQYKGNWGTLMTNGPCVHFSTPLPNYWCLVGDLRAFVSQWGAGVSWEACGLKCVWLALHVQEWPAASAWCLPCKSWIHMIAEPCLWLALISPGRLKDFFLVFVSAQASCFDTTLFFFLAFWPASFLLWLLLHPTGPACPSQPRLLHRPWFVGFGGAGSWCGSCSAAGSSLLLSFCSI